MSYPNEVVHGVKRTFWKTIWSVKWASPVQGHGFSTPHNLQASHCLDILFSFKFLQIKFDPVQYSNGFCCSLSFNHDQWIIDDFFCLRTIDNFSLNFIFLNDLNCSSFLPDCFSWEFRSTIRCYNYLWWISST